MTLLWKNFTLAERDLAKATFMKRQLFRHYSEPAQDSPNHSLRITTQDLYNSLQGQGRLTMPALMKECARDPLLKKKFNWLLQQSAILSVPSVAAAASSDEVFERPLGAGGYLRIIPSRTNPRQVHLVMQLPEGLEAQTPTLLIAQLADQDCHIELPALQDGQIMKLMFLDDPCMMVIQNQESSLVLI